MSEVQFSTNPHVSDTNSNSGLSVSEYVAIGISSLLLGLIYVASVFLYLHVKKRRKSAEVIDKRFTKSIKRRDGKPITEHDIVRINNERLQTISNVMTSNDDGIIKKNPLLTMARQYQDIKSNFTSDSGNNNSDSEDFSNNEDHNDRYNVNINFRFLIFVFINITIYSKTLGVRDFLD